MKCFTHIPTQPSISGTSQLYLEGITQWVSLAGWCLGSLPPSHGLDFTLNLKMLHSSSQSAQTWKCGPQPWLYNVCNHIKNIKTTEILSAALRVCRPEVSLLLPNQHQPNGRCWNRGLRPRLHPRNAVQPEPGGSASISPSSPVSFHVFSPCKLHQCVFTHSSTHTTSTSNLELKAEIAQPTNTALSTGKAEQIWQCLFSYGHRVWLNAITWITSTTSAKRWAICQEFGTKGSSL